MKIGTCTTIEQQLGLGRVGVLECGFHHTGTLHVRPQPKEPRTIEQELDIGRVGVLECGFHRKGKSAWAPSS